MDKILSPNYGNQIYNLILYIMWIINPMLKYHRLLICLESFLIKRNVKEFLLPENFMSKKFVF